MLKNYGIGSQTTVPYSPQQNGAPERKNSTLCKSAHCTLFGAELSTTYWGEAIVTANYLLPTKAIYRTHYDLWNLEKPRLHHLRSFGTKVYCYVPKEKRSKCETRATEGILVGYCETSNGYRILNPTKNKITI